MKTNEMKLLLLFILIPLQLNAYTIDEWVQFYTRDCKPEYTACKQNLEVEFGRMIAYSSLIVKQLKNNDLPTWFATIPIVESGYNEKAISAMGALGIWQLMPYTIERHKTREKTIFGRKVTIVPTDEQIRKYGFNPVSSTQIAVKHLKYLFEKYKDQKDVEKLVIMAYNTGERRVNLWVNGEGQLLQETVDYYNKIMALQVIIKNTSKYNINIVECKKVFIIDYIKALTSMEMDIDRDHANQVVKYILG